MCKMETWLLEDYAEGMLDAASTTILEAHLATCAECRRELTRIKLLFWELESLSRETIAVPDVLKTMEVEMLDEWLKDRESWFQRAGSQIAATVRQTTGYLPGLSGLRQTAGELHEFPVLQQAAEAGGNAAIATAKWLGKQTGRQIEKRLVGSVKNRNRVDSSKEMAPSRRILQTLLNGRIGGGG